ncbi:helix-turn-helix domain-containing protein [Amycolatopsis sp. FDAARGOS 1241]|uniref:MmyB family transcriptional regulator n=1 Tax=Amycolatopsis sp. FDAARGOS 1241 TaxID=2778070 RepID=UPI0019511126|nr:helix-turn-helix domain-containing protein [Amycolatopsis sp. FDAARGOS 1241]QRP49751.1 helix-turn-helix domain-containing protein [Amycolatopsis sp. FDAARGOS 1241]
MATDSRPGPDEGRLDPRAELSEFLRSRRARLKPSDVGLPEYGRRRRVPGLRREELAQVAGVSVAYYTRLEQGNGRNVSLEVLTAISSALKLSETEHAHLLHLAKPKPAHRRPAAPRRQQVRPVLQEMLSAIETVPAYVWGRRTDVLAWNRTASALFGDWAQRAPQDRNWARVVFLDAGAKTLFADWPAKAADVVGQLRLDAGRHPNDPLLTELVGELSVKSEEFRTLWAAHNVKRKTHDTLRLRHPLVGELSVRYETFVLPGDQEQALSIYHAEPATPSEEALRLLASWGTDAPEDPVHAEHSDAAH